MSGSDPVSRFGTMIGIIAGVITIVVVLSEPAWVILSRAGLVLVILAVLYVVWRSQLGRRKPATPRYTEIWTEALARFGADIGQSILGVVAALSCAVLWALSYASYRSPYLQDLNSLEIGVGIYAFATLALFLMSLVLRSLPKHSPLASRVVSPLASSNGIAIVLGNSLEVLFLVGAMQLVTAGQTIALYTPALHCLESSLE